MIEQLLYGDQVYSQLFRFCLILIIGVVATRTVLMPLISRIMSGRNASKKAQHSFENIVGLLGLFTTLLIALQTANFGNLLTILGTLAAAATVAVGFGMRDQVASIVAGVFIHLDNPFVKGDYIRVNDTEGIIKDISLRTTTLNGRRNAEQVVPNNILTTNIVKNYTRGSSTKVSIETTIGSGKAEKASKLILESVGETKEAISSPEPEIRYSKISEGKTEIEATFWIKSAKDVKKTRSEVLKTYSEKAEKKGLFKEEEK